MKYLTILYLLLSFTIQAKQTYPNVTVSSIVSALVKKVSLFEAREYLRAVLASGERVELHDISQIMIDEQLVREYSGDKRLS